MVEIQYKDFLRHASANIIMKFSIAIQSAIGLWLLARRYIGGIINIADFTLYFSSVTTLSLTLNNISDKIDAYKEQMLNFIDYKKLINFTKSVNKQIIIDENIDLEKFENINIKLENVSFKYPSTDNYVLSNINMIIPDKQKLVVVGLNGAGNVDIWEIPNEIYSQIIAAVFQDYANLSFTIKENISFNKDGDEDLVAKSIFNVELTELVEGLKEKDDTYLYKNYLIIRN